MTPNSLLTMTFFQNQSLSLNWRVAASVITDDDPPSYALNARDIGHWSMVLATNLHAMPRSENTWNFTAPSPRHPRLSHDACTTKVSLP